MKDGIAEYIHLWDKEFDFYQTQSNIVMIKNASRKLQIRLEVGCFVSRHDNN